MSKRTSLQQDRGAARKTKTSSKTVLTVLFLLLVVVVGYLAFVNVVNGNGNTDSINNETSNKTETIQEEIPYEQYKSLLNEINVSGKKEELKNATSEFIDKYSELNDSEEFISNVTAFLENINTFDKLWDNKDKKENEINEVAEKIEKYHKNINDFDKIESNKTKNITKLVDDLYFEEISKIEDETHSGVEIKNMENEKERLNNKKDRLIKNKIEKQETEENRTNTLTNRTNKLSELKSNLSKEKRKYKISEKDYWDAKIELIINFFVPYGIIAMILGLIAGVGISYYWKQRTDYLSLHTYKLDITYSLKISAGIIGLLIIILSVIVYTKGMKLFEHILYFMIGVYIMLVLLLLIVLKFHRDNS